MVLANNPIPAILELIPEKEVVLDPELLDSMRLVITTITAARNISNSFIILLLAHISDNKLIHLSKINSVSSPGLIYFVKKEPLDGNQAREIQENW